MVTLLGGLVGGSVATVVMTAFMLVVGDDSPPPTAYFWSKYVGSADPEEYLPHGLVLHLGYGTVAGGVFVLLLPEVGLPVATIQSGLLWGLVWGAVLFVVAAVFWMKLILGMAAEMKQAGLFLFFHLVYGAVLGAWLGFGVLG